MLICFYTTRQLIRCMYYSLVIHQRGLGLMQKFVPSCDIGCHGGSVCVAAAAAAATTVVILDDWPGSV